MVVLPSCSRLKLTVNIAMNAMMRIKADTKTGCELQVYSVNWNMRQRNLFLTGSWDDSIKLWDLNHPSSLQTFREHTYCIYAAIW